MKHTVARGLARLTVALGVLGVLGAATVASVFAWRVAPAPEAAPMAAAPVVESVSPETWRLLHQLTVEPWVVRDMRLFSAPTTFGAQWLDLTIDPLAAVNGATAMTPQQVAQLTFAPWELASN